MQSNRAIGMTLLNDELARLIEARKITMEDALSGTVEKKDLEKRFRSGVTLAADPQSADRFRVIAVNPRSPGADVGLARGMMILEINSKPARQYTLDDVRLIFRTDGSHSLTVERGGKRVKLTLELDSTM